MIKKLISGFLAAVMLMSSLPLGVLAEATIYEKHFVIEPISKISEQPFRRWAADLVKIYRNEYAYVNKSGEFLQSAYDMYEKSGDQWIEKSSMLDDALYHPYYALAEAKEKYNLSKDANAQHDGEIIKSTEYTLLDEQELKGLYLWMIKETIMEKAQMDPGFFEQEVEGNQRLYSFSVSEGKLVMDSMLENLEQSTVQQAWTDVFQTMGSAVKVAVETYLAYDKIGEEAKNIVETAKNKASGKGNEFTLEELCEALKENFIKELTDKLTKLWETGVDEVNKNIQNSIQNIMRAELTAELLDNMMDCNINIVNYLKTTYVETPVYLLDKDFAATVDSVIDVLESPAFEVAIISEAENKVTVDLVNQMMNDAGIELNSIISNSELFAMLGKELVGSLLEALLSTMTKTGEDALEGIIEAAKEEKGDKTKKRLSALEELGKGVLSEIERRFNGIISSMTDYWSKGNCTADGALEALITAWEEQLFGLNNKTPPILDSIISLGSDCLISMCTSFALDNAEKEKKPQDDEYADNLERRISYSSLFSLGSVDIGLADDSVFGYTGLTFIAALMKGFVNNLKENVIENVEPISAATRARIKETYEEMEECITSMEKMISSGEMDDLISVVDNGLQMLADYFTYLATCEPLEAEAIHRATEIDYYIIMNTAESVLKDKEFIKNLMGILFGGTIAQAAKAVTAKDENGDYDIEKIIRGEGIANKLLYTTNESVEGTIKVLGSVWDSMMDCSADLAKAANSIGANLSGEHSASLNAERARQTYEQSKKLEAQNVLFTRGGRAAAYMSYGIKDYETFLDIWNNDPSEKQNRYLMNDIDIIYHDGFWNWPLTPDVEAVRVLTDYILTQMHLDAVGMGAYVTVVANLANREEFESSYLYERYLNKGILLTEDETERRYNMIVEMIREIESKKPALN